MASGPSTVEEYLATLPDDARASIGEMRRIARRVAPDATEVMSYGMPTFKHRGRPLVYFGAWKSHCAVYGLPMENHREELSTFETAKGTIRFPLNKPLPEALLTVLIAERRAAIEAAAAERNAKRSGPAS